MVERAAELARDSHARTRHAAVLVTEGSLLAWGNNGVPFPGEDHCYCKFGEFGHHEVKSKIEQQAFETIPFGGAALIVAYPRSSGDAIDKSVTRSLKKATGEADGKKVQALKKAMAAAQENMKSPAG